MHAYLSDPTGIRDAGIAEPALKAVGNAPRYVVCVRFNAKKRGNEYAGVKEIAAVFMVGRFDRFLEKAQEPMRGRNLYAVPGAAKALALDPGCGSRVREGGRPGAAGLLPGDVRRRLARECPIPRGELVFTKRSNRLLRSAY